MSSFLELQYLGLLKEAHDHGVPIANERTGKVTYTLPPKTLSWDLRQLKTDEGYDVGLATTRKLGHNFMAAEIIGYFRGYDNCYDFEALGTKTLTSNATRDPAWLANPHRKFDGHIGETYGVVGRNYPSATHGSIDLVKKTIDNLRAGIDDRMELVSWLNPGNFDRAMLRPCLHSYQFTLIGKELHVVANQRSCDIPLGGRANMVQINEVIIAMARITGTIPATVNWVIGNPHIYEDQMPFVMEELERHPTDFIPMTFEPSVDLLTIPAEEVWNHIYPSDFVFHGVDERQDPTPVKYPFTTAANVNG